MKNKFILILSCLVYCTTANALFCPNNFNQINMGDSLDTVKQQCGKPDAEETHKESAPTGPQQMTYFVSPVASSSYKMQVNVVIQNNKAISVTTNGVSLNQTNVCGGKTIKVGDTADQIKSACGDPMFVNNSNTSQPMPDTQITTLKYNTSPPVTLTFENGLLKSRK